MNVAYTSSQQSSQHILLANWPGLAEKTNINESALKILTEMGIWLENPFQVRSCFLAGYRKQ